MSSQIAELLEGARQGRWILPLPDEPNPVALARAVASVCGAPGTEDDRGLTLVSEHGGRSPGEMLIPANIA